MIRLATVKKGKDNRSKVEFDLEGIFSILKNDLGYKYIKLDGKGHYLKEQNGIYKIVAHFDDIKNDFKKYIEPNFNNFEISNEIDWHHFLNAYIETSPIKKGNYSKEYLGDPYELSELSKQYIREQLKSKP